MSQKSNTCFSLLYLRRNTGSLILVNTWTSLSRSQNEMSLLDFFQEWGFYLLTFMSLPMSARFMFFKFFYESMLLSILKGWILKRPVINLDETTSIQDWNFLKNAVNEWISYYLDIEVSFDNVIG